MYHLHLKRKNDMKYLKVIFDDKSRYNYQYKIDEVNIANNFNKDAKNPKDMGGFNFSNEENILDGYIMETIFMM